MPLFNLCYDCGCAKHHHFFMPIIVWPRICVWPMLLHYWSWEVYCIVAELEFLALIRIYSQVWMWQSHTDKPNNYSNKKEKEKEKQKMCVPMVLISAIGLFARFIFAFHSIKRVEDVAPHGFNGCSKVKLILFILFCTIGRQLFLSKLLPFCHIFVCET